MQQATDSFSPGTTKLVLVDALAPFFSTTTRDSETVYNWSKVPFAELEKNGLTVATRTKITSAFKQYVASLTKVGYTAITLDDMAHLVVLEEYSDGLQLLIKTYQDWYKQLIAIAKKAGLKVFITTDVVSIASEVRENYRSFSSQLDLFIRSVQYLCTQFPEIDGLVIRVGERDAQDVKGVFQSQLSIRYPKQARQLLTATLPLLEKIQATIIFRTWTVGAYPIGDLTWNSSTFKKVFTGFEKSKLIVSIKHGGSDFFRFLKLNPTIITAQLPFIIEFQAKREYEGSGSLPNFVGRYHQSILNQAKKLTHFTGVSLWVQTGGWTPKVPLTYLEATAIWNELNAWVTVRLVTHQNESLDESIYSFFQVQSWCKDPAKLVQLVTELEQFIEEVLYIKEFANSELYFRRTRIPPLFWVHWQTIYLTEIHKSVLSSFCKRLPPVTDKFCKSEIKRASLLTKKLALLGVPTYRSSLFFPDTVALWLTSKRELLNPSTAASHNLKKLYRLYQAKYPFGYCLQPNIRSSPIIQKILPFLIRTKAEYRLIDRLLLWGPGAILLRLLVKPVLNNKISRQAMGLDSLFL